MVELPAHASSIDGHVTRELEPCAISIVYATVAVPGLNCASFLCPSVLGGTILAACVFETDISVVV